MKHNHKAQADDVLIASARVKSTVPPEPTAGCHPAGFQPEGGNVSTSDSKTSTTRKKSPRDRKAPVAPGDPIGVAATDQIAFANHSSQSQVRGEHGHAAYALFEHEHRDIAHAGPNRHRNDIPCHDVVSG